jgi:hypothetical protein
MITRTRSTINLGRREIFFRTTEKGLGSLILKIRYSTPSGVTAYKTSSSYSTEANSKLRMRKAFTVNNFATFITGKTRDSAIR